MRVEVRVPYSYSTRNQREALVYTYHHKRERPAASCTAYGVLRTDIVVYSYRSYFCIHAPGWTSVQRRRCAPGSPHLSPTLPYTTVGIDLPFGSSVPSRGDCRAHCTRPEGKTQHPREGTSSTVLSTQYSHVSTEYSVVYNNNNNKCNATPTPTTDLGMI